jgi:hypothetical protein
LNDRVSSARRSEQAGSTNAALINTCNGVRASMVVHVYSRAEHRAYDRPSSRSVDAVFGRYKGG